MKAFTDLDQSKKLSEILPLESADQIWARIAIAGANLDVPEELQYKHNGDMRTPCWSLAALLNVLELPTLEKCNIGKDKTGWMVTVYHNNSRYDSFFYNEPVDACYEVIVKLNELKML